MKTRISSKFYLSQTLLSRGILQTRLPSRTMRRPDLGPVNNISRHISRLVLGTLLLPHIVPRLAPPGLDQRGREEPAQDPKHAARNEQADPVGKVVEPRDADGGGNAHVVEEAVEVGDDAEDVGNVGADVPAVGVVVDAFFGWRKGVGDCDVAAANQIVVDQEDAGDGGEKDLVRGQERDKDARGALVMSLS